MSDFKLPLREALGFLSSVYNYNHWIARSIDPFVGESFVEFGCGIGNMLQYFLLRSKVLGLDYDKEMIEHCRFKFTDHKNCQFEQCDLTTLDFHTPDQFDSVITLNVIEHLEDDLQALDYMVSFLRPGGSLVVLVPAFNSIYGQIDKSVGHYRRYVKEDLMKLIGSLGLVCRDSFYFNSIGFFGWALNSKILRKSTIPNKQAMLYDKYVVPFQSACENFIRPPFGQSVIIHATKS